MELQTRKIAVFYFVAGDETTRNELTKENRRPIVGNKSGPFDFKSPFVVSDCR